MSEERKKILTGYGAKLVEISKEEGGFIGSIERTLELAKKDPTAFLPMQFSNPNNIKAHYTSTGPEIYQQLQSIGKTPDAFIAGVGTGGTVMGAGQFLKEKCPNITIHPLEPSNSPTLSTGGKKIEELTVFKVFLMSLFLIF